MSGMFSGTSFNGDLSGWNTGSVTNMNLMFFGANEFNSDISGWNTGSVTDMSNMFYGATSFNGDISGWNTGSVTDMSNMFTSLWYNEHAIADGIAEGAMSLFNGDLSRWNTGSVTDMSNMFDGATSFNSDLSGWNTGSVTDMSWMFASATLFNGDISGWNTGSVTDMSYMFFIAESFNGDLSGWKTGSVTNMGYMFYGANEFNGDISGWNTGRVTDMSNMFAGTWSFNGDISGWNTASVTDMDNIFTSAFLFNTGTIKGWDIGSLGGYAGENQLKFNVPESGVCPKTLYVTGSYCYTCEGRGGKENTLPLIISGVVIFTLLLAPAVYTLGSYLQQVRDDDASSLEFREGVGRVKNVYGVVPIFAQFLTITAIYTSRIPWPPVLHTIFAVWQLFLGAIPGAPTECAGEGMVGLTYGAETLGPLVLTVLAIGAAEALAKRGTCIGNQDTRQLRTKRLTIGFFAMLWNLQTYLFGGALKPLRPAADADGVSMAFGCLTLLVHAVTVVGFGLWLRRRGSADERHASYLAPLVLAYKDSHWWWFIATMLHLDMATVVQVLADPAAGKVVQTVLALLMFLVTYKIQPFDNKPVLLKLMGASLLTQVAVCVSGLAMLLTRNAATRMLIDITLGMLLLAVTGRFLWELRQDIANIRRSAAKACCRRAKQAGSETPGTKDGEGSGNKEGSDMMVRSSSDPRHSLHSLSAPCFHYTVTVEPMEPMDKKLGVIFEEKEGKGQAMGVVVKEVRRKSILYGEVEVGSVLVAVNGEDVTSRKLSAINGLLLAAATATRVLEFSGLGTDPARTNEDGGGNRRVQIKGLVEGVPTRDRSKFFRVKGGSAREESIGRSSTQGREASMHPQLEGVI
jgi:surface protein